MTRSMNGDCQALCYNHGAWRSVSPLPNGTRPFFKIVVFEEEYYFDFPQ